MYNPQSLRAEEFINHAEILDTLEYARAHKNDTSLLSEILAKAARRKGLNHREAAVLLLCEDDAVTEQMNRLARQIKLDFYGSRIVIFAPLYLSNYCVNGCTYCPYHAKNKHISRKKLSQEDIVREVTALQDMGHKRLAIEAGEDPLHNPISYILECIDTIYHIHHKNGAIRRVNVNIAATTEEEYHTEAMDRAMAGGIDDVGLGVLFGLENYPYELVGLLMHAEHLEAVHGVGPHTISIPRIKKAEDINPDDFDNSISDDIFAKICALIRISVPYTGMIISTRESQAVRERLLPLGISQISGGSRTSVGGYDIPETPDDNSAQFDVSDRRSLDEVVRWLMEMDYIPSFCTACYRAGRTGDRFMALCKSGQIQNCCHPNALITLQEFLADYASPETRALGQEVLKRQLLKIPNENVRAKTETYLREILQGARDFRF